MQHSYMHVGVSYAVGMKNREYYWIPEILCGPLTQETARLLAKTLSHMQNDALHLNMNKIKAITNLFLGPDRPRFLIEQVENRIVV